MNCFQVTLVVAKQFGRWFLAVATKLQQICNQVATQILKQQQQWQNSCTSVTSTFCNALPWPLSTLCTVVTTLVCVLVSVLILVLALVVMVVCSVVMLLVSILILVLSIIFFVVVFPLTCILNPCRNRMESSTPPDAGLIVTEGGASPLRLSKNNAVLFLPDAERACQEIVDAINSATTTIHLLQLEFDPGFVATFTPRTLTPDVILTQPLIAAAIDTAKKRGVKVRILMNDNFFLHSIPKLRPAFSGIPNIKLQGFQISLSGFTHSMGFMHAKGMIVDSATAFVDGLPFSQGYWDTQAHFVTDPRRGDGAGGLTTGDAGAGVGKKPVHTLSLRIDGPAAMDFDAFFAILWNMVSSDNVSVSGVAPKGTGRQSVQIVLSAPPRSESGFPNGETGSLEAYLRAIASAKHFMYFENQYFTSPVIRDALVRALKANPSLQLIMLLNENPDIPTYKFWQDSLFLELSKFPSAQFGAFTLWRTQAPKMRGDLPEIMQCYLESKVTIVDDVWAMEGSANLDGASLGHVFEFLPKPFSCMSSSRGWRNVEFSTVLYDGVAGQLETGEVFRLREILWKEHLGLPSIPASPPPGGLLGLWQSNAAANIARLNLAQMMVGEPPSRILPYSPKLDTVSQLKKLGVDVSLFDVAPVVPS